MTSNSMKCLTGITVLALGLCVSPLHAEQLRLRYVPVDNCGNTKQVPYGPEGSWGQRLTGFGMVPRSTTQQIRPTHLVTYRHPFRTGNVTVPMTLPSATPRMEVQSDRIVYNYTSYVIEVRFQADGSVIVVYNSGFLRPLELQ